MPATQTITRADADLIAVVQQPMQTGHSNVVDGFDVVTHDSRRDGRFLCHGNVAGTRRDHEDGALARDSRLRRMLIAPESEWNTAWRSGGGPSGRWPLGARDQYVLRRWWSQHALTIAPTSEESLPGSRTPLRQNPFAPHDDGRSSRDRGPHTANGAIVRVPARPATSRPARFRGVAECLFVHYSGRGWTISPLGRHSTILAGSRRGPASRR